MEDAEALVRGSLQSLQNGKGLVDQDLTGLLVTQGRLLTKLGRAGEAEPLLREALTTRRGLLSAGNWRIGQAESALGACLAAQGRYGQAESLLLSGERAMASAPSARRREPLTWLALLYESWGKPAMAATWRLKLMDVDFPIEPFAY